MRVVRLCLLGLLAYVVSVVFLFPAAPVVDRFKPQLQKVDLTGVEGKLFNGTISQVSYLDDILPLKFSDVGWKLAPAALLSGGAGANIDFKAYGGGGQGLVQRKWNGDIAVDNFMLKVLASELEELLPLPIATFQGELSVSIASLILRNNLLDTMLGQVDWQDAVITTSALGAPMTANLGRIDLKIEPEQAANHKMTVTARGGDVVVDGTVSMTTAGDYSANMLITPSANAPAPLLNGLQRIARPDASGRYRWQQNGNINRLM